MTVPPHSRSWSREELERRFRDTPPFVEIDETSQVPAQQPGQSDEEAAEQALLAAFERLLIELLKRPAVQAEVCRVVEQAVRRGALLRGAGHR